MARLLIGIICLALSGLVCRAAQTYRLDPTNSVMQIHLGTSGALKFAGHEHLIRAPIEKGTFVHEPRDLGLSSVELVVDAKRFQVLDPGLSAQDRQKIQATMESDRVLGVKQFAAITFKSISVQASAANRLTIRGNLTIRDKTRPVTVEVVLKQLGPELTATGQSQFKQTDFGIKPVTAGLGTVRVRDLMTVEFEVVGTAVEK